MVNGPGIKSNELKASKLACDPYGTKFTTLGLTIAQYSFTKVSNGICNSLYSFRTILKFNFRFFLKMSDTLLLKPSICARSLLVIVNFDNQPVIVLIDLKDRPIILSCPRCIEVSGNISRFSPRFG
jgi:hypothetical protein